MGGNHKQAPPQIPMQKQRPVANVNMDPLQMVMEERLRQDAKWGEQNHEDLYWLGIITEELGECAKGIIEGNQLRTTEELIQVTAVGLAWLESITRRAGR